MAATFPRTFLIASGRRWLLAAALALAGLPAGAALNVLACEPEWAALVQELGGTRVNVSSATTALQDPHRIEARPSLIARTRGADLLVCTGLDLEAAWLPLLVRQSGNGRVAPGAPGYFEAGAQVSTLGVPGRLDRSDGDVHAQGNPHVQLDPRNFVPIATALAARLAQLDRPNAAAYAQALEAFLARWQAGLQKWQRDAEPLRGVAVVTHHLNFSYLWEWLGVREIGTLEPKPGVEPSAGHLGTLAARLGRMPARMVVHAAYDDPRAARWMAEQARIPVVVLPFTVGGNAQASDLFGLFDSTVALLLAAGR